MNHISVFKKRFKVRSNSRLNIAYYMVSMYCKLCDYVVPINSTGLLLFFFSTFFPARVSCISAGLELARYLELLIALLHLFSAGIADERHRSQLE